MKTSNPRFLYLLAAAMLLLAGSGLRADTIVTDPKGRTLQLGRSEVTVDFSATNFDPELKNLKWGNSKCLIMGMIDGRIVVANTDQTKPATKNKLFYVTLLGDGIASFSGLIEDRIQLQGPVELSKFVKKEVLEMPYEKYYTRTRTWIPYARGQLLQWTGVNRDGTPARYLFMIDGYQRDIDVFTLKDAAVTGEPIGVQTLAFTRKLLLPGKYGVEGYEINALDCIDLNAFRDTTSASATSAPADPLPRALMIWCKPQNKNGWMNSQLVFPTDVLTCSVDDAVTDIQVNAQETRPYDTFSDALNGDHIDNLVGGYVTAPDEKGNLCYWFSDLRVENYTWSGEFYFRINKKPIVYKPGAAFLTTQTSSRTTEYWYKADFEAAKFEMWDDLAVDNCGPKVVFETNAPHSVSMVPAVSKDKSNKSWRDRTYGQRIAGNEFIGICDLVPQSEVDQINKSTRIIGGAIPSDQTERLKRVAVVEGYTVLRVFLGQPYLAVTNENDPSFNPGKIFKLCSYKYNYTSSSLYQNSFNNGTSTKADFGIVTKKKDFYSYEGGVTGSFEYDYNKDTTTEIKIGSDFKQVASTADSFELGSIVYTKIQPRISTMARVVPSKESKQLTVVGDTNAYQLLMINTSPQQASDQGAPIFLQQFSLTNPALVNEGMDGQPGKEYYDAADHSTKKSSFTTPYSVLSDGLLPRPFSSLISCTNTNGSSSLPTVVIEAHKKITAWEDTNNLIADIQQFNSEDGGVSAYFGTLQNGTVTRTGDGSFDLGYNVSANYSIVNKSETKVTRTRKWSAGFYWKIEHLWFATKGEFRYVGGLKEVNTDSKENKFEIGIGGWDKAPNYLRSYYYFNIDVPSIKSYMASHSYSLQSGENKGSYTNEVHRPAFIPAYCWLHNQSFMLGVPWIKPWVNSAQPNR
jgi:hypothetical protein